MREHLARALEEAGAPSYFIQRVRDGVYDHFRSTRVNPHGENLISHATKEELWDIVRRAKGASSMRHEGAAPPALNDRQRAYLLAIFETDQELS